MLNLGITLLHAGRAVHAFDCFVMAVQRYHRNPRIWLRLAECCIQVHKTVQISKTNHLSRLINFRFSFQSNKVDFDYKKQSKIISDQIGSGKYKKLILLSNLSKDKKYSAESQSSAVPVPTLEFAVLCLRNALILLPTENPNTPATTAPPTLATTTLTGPSGPPQQPSGPSVSPSSVASKNEINSLRKSVLAAAAYVSLCVGDYAMTLKYSKTLLEQPELSSVHK